MGLSLSGLGSGLDWKSIIDQLRQVEQQQLVGPLQTQKSRQQDVLTAWNDLSTKLSSLLTAVDDIKDSSDFDVFTSSLTSSSSLSADSLLSVTVGSSASRGRYDIVISNLAKAEKLQSDSVSSSTSDTGWTGTITIEGHDITLDGKSLTDLQDEINSLNSGDNPTGVIASILQVSDSDYRLILTSEEEGAAGIDFTDAAGDYFDVLQAGEDAQFSIDGISMTRSSNTITDAIPGVTLNLKGEDGSTTVTLDISRDQDAITQKIQTFVNAYNDVIGYINDQQTYDSTTDSTGGVLFGDAMANSIRDRLQMAVLDGELYDYGITFENDGTLSFDSDDLESKLSSDFQSTVSDFNSVAQSLDTILDGLTDSVDGTVTLQKDSVQDSIDSLDEKISDLQDRIDQEMQRIQAQFIAMDNALNQMQAQSSWLNSQLSSLMTSSASSS